jgi:hypothetical protein
MNKILLNFLEYKFFALYSILIADFVIPFLMMYNTNLIYRVALALIWLILKYLYI